jgi:TPR repeat protein
MITILKPLLCILILTSLLNATPFEDAAKLYNDKKYAQSFNQFMILSKQDNIDAQYNIGLFYYKGIHVQKDLIQSYIWFSTAASKGHILSQNKLATMYEHGEVEGIKSKAKAIEEYEKASLQGYNLSQLNLAMLYNDDIREDSLKKAFYWYKKSAIGGNTAAMNNLASMYYSGHAIKKNFKEAFVWYLKAAQLGDYIAQFNLSMMYYNAEYVKKSDSSSLFWLEQSVKKGYSRAQTRLANLYRSGDEIVNQDYKKAFLLYNLAANNKSAEAMFFVGFCYFFGYGVDKNNNEAARFMHKAKENGYIHAKSFMERNNLTY